MSDEFDFYDEASLVSRLTRAIVRRPQEVIFLVGSPFSAPLGDGQPGVPLVGGIIDMIRAEFSADPAELAAFDNDINSSGERRYQIAFRFLQGNRGQPVANEIIRRAVMRARTNPETSSIFSEEVCRMLEGDNEGWSLSPSTTSLAQLATRFPSTFGKAILTTNFDPLIEIGIRRCSGKLFRTSLHADGDLYQTEGDGCHIIHLHGYWYNSDTLNTVRQLTQERPRLKASLTSLLKDRLVVVCGYGGWNDVFTSTLLDLVRDDSAGPEVLWTFHSKTPAVVADLGEQLAPGIARGRVLLYAGIDCNSLLPSVLKFWNETAEQKAGLDLGASRTNQVRVSSKFQAGDEVQFGGNSLLEGDDEDRPPLIDLCVGREAEQDIIEAAPAKVLFITGIGGQGKSTLAANYFSKMQRERSFQYFIWRDCKEQAERFENQLASVIEVLSNGLLKGQTLAKQPIETLIEILEALLRDISVLFVFDNVDHYVNLTAGTLTAAADLFLKAFVSSGTSSRAIFTCRPDVRYAGPNYLSLRLEGLSAEATLELFLKRKADSPRESVLRAHRLTGGHAFWLDLLAHQVTRGNSNTALETLLDDAESNSGDEANSTLRAIWRSLRDNEKAVLRFMAETVRPETDLKLAEYLRAEMNVNRLTKSIRSLKRQNLLVIKQAKSGEEFLELHPIVRQFVRTNFTIGERSKIITTIFLVYQRFMVKYRDEIRSKPTFTVLQHWTQAAELALEAGRLQDAINSLADSGDAFASSTYPREYIRAARMLFDSFDWVRESTKYKHFDPVFRVYVRTLTYLGEYREADELLDQFALTVLEEDSRFLFYCAVRTFHGWQKGSFEEAVEWGRKGLAIIKATGVDVEVEIEHSLALAERDAGRPEIALPMFLSGSTLSTVIDPDELDESRHGAFYGNIGRCLQFMDRADEALICYQKSALLVERSDSGEHAVNFGFARLWIGEVLLSKGQKRLALTFLEAARRRWQDVSPPLMRVVEALQEKLGEEAIELRDSSENVEKICRKWIFGAYLDSA